MSAITVTDHKINPEDVLMMPAGNRTIKTHTVNKMVESIKKYGIVRDMVVIKTDLFGAGNNIYCADGQHLLSACQQLGIVSQLGIKYCKVKWNTIQEVVEFIADLNTTQSPWGIVDFVEAFASTSVYHSYNVLKAKHIRHKMPYSLLATVYGQESKSVASKNIKKGTFRIKDEKMGDEILDICKDVSQIFGRINSTPLNHLAFVLTSRFDPSYDKEKLKTEIEKNKEDLLEYNSEGMRHFLRDFEDQYLSK